MTVAATGPAPRRRDRGPRRDDRGPRPDDAPARRPRPRVRMPPREDRGRRARRSPRRRPRRGPRRRAATTVPRPTARAATIAPPRRAVAPRDLSASEAAEVAAARGSLAAERAELEAAEASPEALAAGQRILETLMGHLGFDARVEVAAGETSRLNVVAQGDEREALGALIGRKGERLSALQHLVNLMLSKEMGALDPRPGRRRGLPRPARAPAPRARRPCRGTGRRDRQDAPAGADAGPRATLDPPHAARSRRRRHAVDRRGAEPSRGPRPARRLTATRRAAARANVTQAAASASSRGPVL